MHFIFDTLVWKNETAGPIPLLAEDWEYSPEEDVYVFNLAENAKWHDGEPVTADDVAFTITYMKALGQYYSTDPPTTPPEAYPLGAAEHFDKYAQLGTASADRHCKSSG